MIETVRRRSLGPLATLNALPRSFPSLAVSVLLLAGLLTHGVVAFLLLLVVGLFLGWLALLSWPAVSPGGRLLRVGGTLFVLAYAALQLLTAF